MTERRVELRRAVALIAKKELLEILRDRRSLIVLLLVPVLLYPVMSMGMMFLATAQLRKLAAQTHRVWVEDLVHTPPDLIAALDGPDGRGLARLELVDLPAGADVDAALSSREVVAVLRGAARAEQALEAGKPAELSLAFHSGIDTSEMAAQRIERALERWSVAVAKERLASAELPESTLDPVRVTHDDRGPPGAFLARMLASMLVLLTLTSAFYPALDVGAGEKERGTLETLLLMPVPRLAVALGKMTAVATVAGVSTLLHLLSLGGTFSAFGRLMPALPGSATIAIGPTMLLSALVVLLPLVVLTSALAMALSSFAASYKEGNAYLTPLLLLGTCAALVAAVPGARLDLTTALVPGVSATLLLRELMVGTAGAGQVVVVFLSNLLWAGIAVRWAAALYDQEDVLLRPATAPGPDLLGIAAKRRAAPAAGRTPTMPQALALAILVLGLLGVIGPELQSVGPALGVALTLALLVVLPVMAYARLLGCDARATFSLVAPHPLALIAVPLFATGLLLLLPDLARLQAELSGPISPEEKRAIEEQLADLNALHPIQLALLFAVLPAICEEMVFRGFVLRGLLPAGKGMALLGSACLFALAHLDPGRLLPTFAGGLLLGALVLRGGSLVPAMLLHASINGGVLLTEAGWLAGLRPAEPGAAHRAGAAAAIGAGAGLLALVRPRAPDQRVG